MYSLSILQAVIENDWLRILKWGHNKKSGSCEKMSQLEARIHEMSVITKESAS